MKKYLFAICVMIALNLNGYCQFYNDGDITNDGNSISDWQSQWFNLTNATYNGSNDGVFEHYGPSSQTFINDGNYIALTGHSDLFMGPLGVAGDQEIGGSVRPMFFNLILQNGASGVLSITNTDGANVAGTLSFSNGITTTVRNAHQAGALRFESGATYTGGNSDAQHVDGYVTKTGTSAFNFPTGSGTDLRSLSISAPASSLELSVAWFEGDPGAITDPSDGSTHSISQLGPGITTVSTAGFWDWIPVAGTGEGLTVTVSIPDLSGFAVAADLRLTGWDGSAWIDLSGASTASGNTENSTLSGTIPAGSTITAIGIASTTYILPVILRSFSVRGENCRALLNWESGTEDNVAYYEILNSSNGADFISIGKMNASGTDSRYAFQADGPGKGTQYFRLRTVDLDGSAELSKIISITLNCVSTGIRVYPNPARNFFVIEGLEKKSIIRISNMLGQPLLEIPAVERRQRISLDGIPPGSYWLQAIQDNSIVFKSIIIHKP